MWRRLNGNLSPAECLQTCLLYTAPGLYTNREMQRKEPEKWQGQLRIIKQLHCRVSRNDIRVNCVCLIQNTSAEWPGNFGKINPVEYCDISFSTTILFTREAKGYKDSLSENTSLHARSKQHSRPSPCTLTSPQCTGPRLLACWPLSLPRHHEEEGFLFCELLFP